MTFSSFHLHVTNHDLHFISRTLKFYFISKPCDTHSKHTCTHTHNCTLSIYEHTGMVWGKKIKLDSFRKHKVMFFFFPPLVTNIFIFSQHCKPWKYSLLKCYTLQKYMNTRCWRWWRWKIKGKSMLQKCITLTPSAASYMSLCPEMITY